MLKKLIYFSLILSLGFVISCKKAEPVKPVYKFYAKINGVEWLTNQTTYDSQIKYISECSYSSNYIYFTVYDPITTESIYFRIYIDKASTAVGKYTLNSSSKASVKYYLNDSDNISDGAYGTFEITKFSLDNKFDISSFSARFSLTQTAKHDDGETRTTNLTEGEINDMFEVN